MIVRVTFPSSAELRSGNLTSLSVHVSRFSWVVCLCEHACMFLRCAGVRMLGLGLTGLITHIHIIFIEDFENVYLITRPVVFSKLCGRKEFPCNVSVL